MSGASASRGREVLTASWKVSFGSKPLDSSSQVPDLEEPTHIYGAAVKHIVSIDVGEAGGSQVEPTTERPHGAESLRHQDAVL